MSGMHKLILSGSQKNNSSQCNIDNYLYNITSQEYDNILICVKGAAIYPLLTL